MGKLVLVLCALVGTSQASPPDQNGRRFEEDTPRSQPYDGEMRIPRGFKYDFVLTISNCPLGIPELPDNGMDVFRCGRDGADMVCTVRSVDTMDGVFSVTPFAKALRAPISKDGVKVVFATPAQAFRFSVDTKALSVTLTRAEGSCKGSYATKADFTKMKEAYIAQHPVDDAPSSEPAPRTSPPASAKRPAACLARGAIEAKDPSVKCCAGHHLRKGERVCD